MGIAGLPRIALIAVCILVVATVIGMVALWPRGSTDAELADSLRPPTFSAEVVGVEAADCQAPQGQRCLTVKARFE
jgi:hypothetical protein